MLLLCCLLCVQDAPAFSETDVKQTLFWLDDLRIKFLTKTGNSLVDEENRAKFEKAVSLMKGKTIRYTLEVARAGKEGVALKHPNYEPREGPRATIDFYPHPRQKTSPGSPATSRYAYFQANEGFIRKLRAGDAVVLEGTVFHLVSRSPVSLHITRYKLSLPSP